MTAPGSLAWLAAAACVAVALLPAQDSRPAPPPELRKSVEAYLGERTEAEAAKLLDALLRRPDATGANVVAAVVASDEPVAPSLELVVPWRDQLLATTVSCPDGHARTGERLPAVFDVSEGASSPHLALGSSIVAFVKGYTPPEFSDEGRDGFLKVLRTVAHRAHGDPGRLWLCGFSWAGHASWDVALHRPGALRGIVPMGGGPRRNWYRLLAQLGPTRVRSFCGAKDDAELVWNLREVERLAPQLKIDFVLTLDPEAGHTLPLKGIDGVAAVVQGAAALPAAVAASGSLLADAANVESPVFRILAVDEKRVTVPQRIPVDGSASPDAQRRATIAAMAKQVARLGWKIEEGRDETVVTLASEGVGSANVILREPFFHAGRKVTVRVQGKPAFSEVLAPDPRTVLAEARRTGERLRPALRTIEVRFAAK